MKHSHEHTHPDRPKPVKTERERDNDTGTIRRRVSFPPQGKFPPSKTEQSHKQACDINNIMARYVKTGTLEHVRTYEPQYLDTSPDDYHASETKVAEARTMFEDLPARMRAHFNNDPAAFLNYCVTTPKPGKGLSLIAEEYRKQSLGLDGSLPDGAKPSNQNPSVADNQGAPQGAGSVATDPPGDTPKPQT